MKPKLLTTLAAILIALSAWANGTEINGIYYELDSSAKTASVTYTGSNSSSGNNYLGDITIPATVTYGGTTYSVTSIGEDAFDGCTGLTSITIPNSVTNIGNEAFYGCTGLTSISIPESVTSIGERAFYGCTGLTSITIPNSVTTIGNSAFYGCTGLTSITIPNSVTSINNYAFEGCTGLTSITIPNSVTSIGNWAFDGCTGLTSISIPESVTSIGNRAFAYCSGLTSITIPESVTSIPSSAFDGCTSLTSITIPNSVTSIEYAAFKGCTGLTSITIPNSVTIIWNDAFYGCTGLTSITLRWDDPTNCTYINDILYGVPTSATLYVPVGTKALYENTEPWSRFENIVERGGTEINGIYYNLDSTAKTATVTYTGSDPWSGNNYLGDITIPATVVTYGGTTYSVTSIGNEAFRGCTGLTSITIPSSVTSIGWYAFDCCTGLTSITIGNSVTSIGERAFNGCTDLTSITIPKSVTSIGDYAFSGCSALTSITIPSSVTSIGDYAFFGCIGLTSIKVEEGNTKYDSRDNCNAIIETATNTLIAGCNATTIPKSVTSIGGSAFYYCTGLTSITIPNSVTSIGNWAFGGCSGLTSITLSWDDPTNCTYGSSMLYGVPTSATLYVPAGTKALYKNTEPWSSFENIVEPVSVITLSNTMGTYCDFSGLDFSSVEGLEAYTATGYASGEVTLTRVNYVPANTGIVLRGTAGVYEVPQQKVNAYLTNLLKGTTSPITLNQTEGDMTNYILANGSKGIGFYKVASGGGTLAANKAYLQLPSNLSATRPMMLRFEDEDGQTTDIQYLYTSSDDETAPAIFDLQGRRVSGTMQQSGIYIVGGKKVMAK